MHGLKMQWESITAPLSLLTRHCEQAQRAKQSQSLVILTKNATLSRSKVALILTRLDFLYWFKFFQENIELLNKTRLKQG